MSDELKVGRIAFGPNEGGKLAKAIRTLKNPAPGVSLVSHGWTTRCNICEKSTHAKWHEESKGEIINPIALLEFIDRLPRTEEVAAIRNWITFICGIESPIPEAKP